MRGRQKLGCLIWIDLGKQSSNYKEEGIGDEELVNENVERPNEQEKGYMNVKRRRYEKGIDGQLVWRKKVGENEYNSLMTKERDVEKRMVGLIQYIGSQLGLNECRNSGLCQVV